jgi:hypothetical protein
MLQVEGQGGRSPALLGLSRRQRGPGVVRHRERRRVGPGAGGCHELRQRPGRGRCERGRCHLAKQAGSCAGRGSRLALPGRLHDPPSGSHRLPVGGRSRRGSRALSPTRPVRMGRPQQAGLGAHRAGRRRQLRSGGERVRARVDRPRRPQPGGGPSPHAEESTQEAAGSPGRGGRRTVLTRWDRGRAAIGRRRERALDWLRPSIGHARRRGLPICRSGRLGCVGRPNARRRRSRWGLRRTAPPDEPRGHHRDTGVERPVGLRLSARPEVFVIPCPPAGGRLRADPLRGSIRFGRRR